jgi:hypothetical protein
MNMDSCIPKFPIRIPIIRDISVGIATRYGLDGPGIESRWGRDFPHPSRQALGATQPPIQWVTFLLPGVQRLGRGVDHTLHLVPMLKKELTYNSTPPLGLHGLFYGELYLLYFTLLLLYSYHSRLSFSAWCADFSPFSNGELQKQTLSPAIIFTLRDPNICV